MKAVLFEAHGGPEVLRYTDLPEPTAGPNDVVVKVRAAAANFNDIWARRGLPGMKVVLPHVSGSDVAGDVVEVGSEVSGVSVGDAVLVHPGLGCRNCQACAAGQEVLCREFRIWGFQTGPNDGGHAEFVRLPGYNVVPKPTNLTYGEAASLPLVLETVWRMLSTRAKVRPGQFVLIWGAAGGLGTMAIQVARVFGAVPIAVVGDEAKMPICTELGAEHVINRQSQDVAAEVMEVTRKRGVDVVFEHTGQATWETSIRCMRWHASLVVCGATSGFEGKTDLRFLWNKQLNLLGSHLGTKAELLEALSFVEMGRIRPVVRTVLPLSEVARGQTMMEERESMGKIVYLPDGSADED